jgi:hypothetical protein
MANWRDEEFIVSETTEEVVLVVADELMLHSVQFCRAVEGGVAQSGVMQDAG